MIQKLQRIRLRRTGSRVEWYLLRIMVLLVMGKSAENIGEKKKRDKRKTLKSGEEEKPRIRGKSNNSNIHLWL